MAKKKKPFSGSSYLYGGADDIYTTKNSIAIRKVWYDGKKNLHDKTYYLPKTSQNLSKAHKTYGHIRSGR